MGLDLQTQTLAQTLQTSSNSNPCCRIDTNVRHRKEHLTEHDLPKVKKDLESAFARLTSLKSLQNKMTPLIPAKPKKAKTAGGPSSSAAET